MNERKLVTYNCVKRPKHHSQFTIILCELGRALCSPSQAQTSAERKPHHPRPPRRRDHRPPEVLTRPPLPSGSWAAAAWPAPPSPSPAGSSPSSSSVSSTSWGRRSAAASCGPRRRRRSRRRRRCRCSSATAGRRRWGWRPARRR